MNSFASIAKALAASLLVASLVATPPSARGQGGDTAIFTTLPFIDPFSSELGDIASDVNNTGQVVGLAGIGDDPIRAVQWAANGTVSDLGADPDFPQSSAMSISSNGQVIVGMGVQDSNFGARAFVWKPGTGIVRLPDFAGSFDDATQVSMASTVSDDGSTAWGSSVFEGFGGSSIVRWNTSTLQITNVGTLAGGAVDCGIYDTTANGQIAVGYSADARGKLRAVRVVGLQINALPRLSSGNEAVAGGTDSTGATVVGTEFNDSEIIPFIWRAGVGIQELPRLRADSNDSTPNGIADNGVVVGTDSLTAVLWVGERPVSLRSYLRDKYGVVSDLFDIRTIAAISRDGRQLTGYGYSDSIPRAFRVTFVGNRPPMANAGADIRKNATNANGLRVTLYAGKSADPDNGALRFRWKGATFDDPKAARATAKFPVGTTTARLEVRDPQGVLSKDEVKVIIKLKNSSIRPQGLAANEAFADASTLSATANDAGETNEAALVAAENLAAAEAIGAAIGDAFVWGEDESPAGAAAEYGALRSLQSAYGVAAAASFAQAYLETGNPAYAEAYRSATLGTQRALADVAE